MWVDLLYLLYCASPIAMCLLNISSCLSIVTLFFTAVSTHISRRSSSSESYITHRPGAVASIHPSINLIYSSILFIHPSINPSVHLIYPSYLCPIRIHPPQLEETSAAEPPTALPTHGNPSPDPSLSQRRLLCHYSGAAAVLGMMCHPPLMPRNASGSTMDADRSWELSNDIHE